MEFHPFLHEYLSHCPAALLREQGKKNADHVPLGNWFMLTYPMSNQNGHIAYLQSWGTHDGSKNNQRYSLDCCFLHFVGKAANMGSFPLRYLPTLQFMFLPASFSCRKVILHIYSHGAPGRAPKTTTRLTMCFSVYLIYCNDS